MLSHALLDRLGPGFFGLPASEAVLFIVFIMAAMQVVSALCFLFGKVVSRGKIAVRGKHLDALSGTDLLFISLNTCMTGVFALHFLRFMWSQRHPRSDFLGLKGHVEWEIPGFAAGNGAETALFSLHKLFLDCAMALPLFVCYDLVYTVFHHTLHLRMFYRFVHKHHHRQKVWFPAANALFPP
jgi:hypothetical protein